MVGQRFRNCIALGFSGCGTGCNQCDISSTGTATCRSCDASYVLENNQCKGTIAISTFMCWPWRIYLCDSR